MTRKLVIYTRYSSANQREESCADQERNIREGLTRKNIDHTNAVVLNDQAERGDKADRDGFRQLQDMSLRGEIGILAVDDQGRFSRGDNAFALIQDLVFSGGRFISTGEGLDTAEVGWELRVKVMELHHSTSNRERARQVRRGQEGRVRDGNGSAGDFCFGYRSTFVDPNWAEYSGRGPRPKKDVVIYEPEARIVRLIFSWFVLGRSIGWITKELNRQKIPKGHRSTKPGWHHEQVRRILGNRKYNGRWPWGETRTLRDSKGKKKQVPVDPKEAVEVDRPDMRIVDAEAWNRVQSRLATLHDIYGYKPGQKRRGPRVHHTEVYPTGLLNGLLFCGECGARLIVLSGGGVQRLGCPNHAKGLCDLVARVRVDTAEKGLVALVGDLLRGWPEWLQTAWSAMRRRISELASQVPEELAADERQLARLEKEIDNLGECLARGTQSPTLKHKLDEREEQVESLRKRIEEQKIILTAPVAMPEEEWFQAQLADLVSVLNDDKRQAALFLRRILGKVRAFEIRAPGKKRGYIRLRFRVNAWATLKEALQDLLPDVVIAAIADETSASDSTSPEFVLDLGQPTRMDKLAPQIVALREQGHTWDEIGRRTGIRPGNAWTVWKRHTSAEGGDSAA